MAPLASAHASSLPVSLAIFLVSENRLLSPEIKLGNSIIALNPYDDIPNISFYKIIKAP
jgi:hypothetical protein